MGASALRANAVVHEGGGPVADEALAARYRAAARSLGAIADGSPDPARSIGIAEALRHLADSYMGCDARFSLLCEAESAVRRATGVHAEPIAVPEDPDEFPEDRVSRLGVLADPRDLAASLLGAVEGERLGIASAACGILARLLLDHPASIGEDDRRAIAEAVRRDWTLPT